MRNFDDTSSMEQAFHSRVHSKESSNDNGEGTSKGRLQPRPLCEIQCYYCHKYGHILKHCKKRQEDESVDAKFMNEDDSKAVETMFMTYETNELIKDDVWKDLTANDDLIVAVDNALHSNF